MVNEASGTERVFFPDGTQGGEGAGEPSNPRAAQSSSPKGDPGEMGESEEEKPVELKNFGSEPRIPAFTVVY
jgi:hypothetical protein